MLKVKVYSTIYANRKQLSKPKLHLVIQISLLSVFEFIEVGWSALAGGVSAYFHNQI